MKKSEQSLKDLCDHIKHTSVCVMIIQEGKEKMNKTNKKLLKKKILKATRQK